jgi:hypothetical protein
VRGILNKLGRTAFVLGVGSYIAIHAVAKAHPAPGWNVLLYVLMGVGATLVIITEGSIRDRRPTLHIGVHAGVLGAWVRPPARPPRGFTYGLPMPPPAVPQAQQLPALPEPIQIIAKWLGEIHGMMRTGREYTRPPRPGGQ